MALVEVDYACWIAEALVDYFTRQGRYHESRTALEITLAHVDEATDPRMGLAPRNCLAYTGVHQRRYSQSRTLFTEAFNLSRRALDPAEEARALIGLASVDVSVGKGDQAISRVTTGLNVSRPPHNARASSIAFVIQDLAHQLERRNEEALACFAEARTHADRSRGPRLLGRVLSFAAGIYLRLGRYADAKSLLRQAVHLAEEAAWDVFLSARGLTRLARQSRARKIWSQPWPSIIRPHSKTSCCHRSPNPPMSGWRWTSASHWDTPTWRPVVHEAARHLGRARRAAALSSALIAHRRPRTSRGQADDQPTAGGENSFRCI
ncbi:tetratricopeptide repeat protein [Streptomyces goshikiensis]|uniref:tetratricopeptide repeat protein n=1 Tax=Streptomyces goshikiensis TaxID=1942 RepID=UPI0036DF3156